MTIDPQATNSAPAGAPTTTPGHRRPSTVPLPVPLVVRSHYSFLTSTLSPRQIVELAVAHGMPAVALCDQGNLHGAVEFAAAARAAGVKPILGAELRCGSHPLWLYVETATGYANLCRLLSDPLPSSRPEEADDAERVLPRTPRVYTAAALAELPRDGLLAVSPDPGLAPLFPRAFYRALRTRGELRQVNPGSDDLPSVPIWSVHHARPEDRWQLEVVQSIRTLTLLKQPHPDKVGLGNHHFRGTAELARVFGAYPHLGRTSGELAERCAFSFRFGQPQFPDFRTPDGTTPRAFLRELVLRGLARRYPPSQVPRLRAQVEEELAMIAAVGYEEYFLAVWDLLGACREHGIDWITRGSAADSLVCYCLGISGVCPIRFDLYFRRFLNAERMAMSKLPDIDIDFPHDRKDDVVDLLFARYGPEHCAVVGGFSTFQTRSAFAEVAKVFGVAEREVRRFTEHFPWSFGGSWTADSQAARGREAPPGGRLAARLAAMPECRDLPLSEEPFATALTMAEFLDGVPRYPKMHPCGVVLSRQPMHALTATFTSSKGYPTTHFDMDAVEAIGLVKMDILAQGGLAVMGDVKARLLEQAVALDLDRCRAVGVELQDEAQALPCPTNPESGTDSPALLFSGPAPSWEFDDPEVWDLIASGQARAVHHIESPAMTSLCRLCNVHDIDTLIAIVSVIRPGAANEDKKREFARRYQGLSPVCYPHPTLESCLRSTFGLVVYEEHILQICEAFAGLPGGRADVLRRALVKDNGRVVAELAPEFAAAARARGRTEEEIARVWQVVTGFHGYAFCKAHSTAYGVEAYQSAWLKRYDPAQFLAAVLTHGKGFYRPLVYVLEAHRLGVPLLPPWVNAPGPAFAVEGLPPPPPPPPWTPSRHAAQEPAPSVSP